MKNFILIVLFFGSLSISFAQDLNGKFFVGGSIGFDFTSADADINTSNFSNNNANQTYNINPSIGYYLDRNIAIGLSLGYSYALKNTLYITNTSNINNTSTLTTTSKVKIIAPLLRYTVPINDKFGFIINTTLPYSYTENTFTYPNNILMATTSTGNIIIPNGDKNTSSSFGLNIGPGFQWFIKDNLALLFSFGSLGYINTKASGNIVGYQNGKTNATTTSNDFKLSLTTSISAGVAFYFRGSK